MGIPYIRSNSGTINAVVKGKAYVIPRDHGNYKQVVAALVSGNEDDFIAQADMRQAVVNFTTPLAPVGKVEIKGETLYFNGEPMHNAITRRIFDLMREGFPSAPMVRFLENLMSNPSFRAVNELLPFLDRQGLPVTEDGCFLGYKSVKADWTDRYTGKIDNKIGSVVKVERNTVDDNWSQLCSSGLHVGSLEYVKSFHNYGCGDHVLIVKVNPKDVVSVPSSEQTKLRTCEYTVVGEYDENLLQNAVYLKGSVYTASGERATAPVNDTLPAQPPVTDPANSGETDGGVHYPTPLRPGEEPKWDDEDQVSPGNPPRGSDDDDEFEDEEDSDLDDDEYDDEDDDLEDDEDEDDEDDEGDDGLDIVGNLVLAVARKLKQPFTRQELEREAGKADGAPNATAHNHEVREAIYLLIDGGKIVPTGTGTFTVRN